MNQVQHEPIATTPDSAAKIPRLTFTQAVIAGIRQEMARDPSVFYLGQDAGPFGGAMQGTVGLYEAFGPERVMEAPISESSMVGIGLGASMFGRKAIVEVSFGEFLPSAMNQLINQAPNIRYMTGGTMSAPAVIRTRVGDGPYRGHPQDYSVWFTHVPGMKVVMPATPPDAFDLIRAAIRDPDPVLFIEPMSLAHGRREAVDVTSDVITAGIGQACVARAGKDVTLVTYGSQLHAALKVADHMADNGVDMEVIDLRTLVPWDAGMVIDSVRKTGRLVVVHEAWKQHGFGAEVVARVLEELGGAMHIRAARVGSKPVPIPSGPLRQLALPSEDDIHTAILAVASGHNDSHGGQV